MRLLRLGFLPVSLVILVTAALLVPLPLYRERPGRIVSLGACVEVEDAGGLDGDYLLTTITVLTATLVDAVPAVVDGNTRVVSRRRVIPPGMDSGQFFEQQRDVFAASADVAAAVGLEAAGLDATVTGDGVRVVRVVEGSPAAGVLVPGDVITGAGTRRIDTEEDLRSAVGGSEQGDVLTVRFQRGGETLEADLTPTEIEGARVIGIIPQTLNARVDLPVPVEVASGTVGGPSAGLMIALTVYDMVLDDVDLSAGRVVAGTGTVDPTGRVGPVAGAGLKVLAAERIDADVFLAPVANYEEAAAALPDGSPMRVMPVETFDDAREALADTAGVPPRGGGLDGQGCPYDPPA